MILGLDHIGVAVESLEKGLESYSKKLGFHHHHTEEVPNTEEVPTENVRVALLFGGPDRVELLEPTSDQSPIALFLKKRGPGVHHLAFRVDDIEKEIARLRGEGVQLIEPAPRPGAEGAKVAFIHPKSTGGVLIELVERARRGHSQKPAE
ncbi:MAG TPA: methylmalonyl-CoA epimerase [Bdellovibrionota bacterium]|nr:methylmalonyl-CoA epimerase [Bdellovibrionota bacterium]